MGAITISAIEKRFSVRVRVLVPASGLPNAVHQWLDARVGRAGYRIWPDRHGPRLPQTTAVFLDDLAIAAELLQEFGLELAPDHGSRAHA